jgi:hypothetical protein
MWAWPCAGAEDELTRLPLWVHLTRSRGEDVATRAFIERQIARANEIFAPYGVGFELRTLSPSRGPSLVERRADRDALASEAKAGAINCFVVASLIDVDEPPRVRRGVHWHAGNLPGAHYVILSAIAEPEVLAHELGHFLGNPRHSEVPGNLMSYQRGEGLPFLDAAQQRRVRAAIRDYRRSGELR